jgi:hypothetical protein
MNDSDILFFADSSSNGSGQDPEDPEAPVLLRRKRYVKRGDRCINSLATAMDPGNYDKIPPVTLHST